MPVKNKRCLYCKDYFLRDSGIICNLGFFHSKECQREYGMRNTKKLIEKSRKTREDKTDAYFKAKKDDFVLNDLPKQHKLTQKAFNRLRVLQELKWFKDRSTEPYCISCGKTNMDWCCGHFKTVGSQGNLRYDVINTYLQCNRYCNKALSGNIEGNKDTRGYKQGLLIRFGKEESERIITYCETNTQVKKWIGSEIKEMRLSFNRMIRDIIN